VLGAVLESQVGLSGGTQILGQVAQGVAAGYVAKYSREQELQADTLGAEYLARSQYDPRNMIDVIRVLKSQESFAQDEARATGQRLAERESWLSSHPSNEQRLQSISQNAARYQGAYASDGQQGFLQAIEGLRFGESPEQGLTRGQSFYHPPMGIAMTAPAGWRIQNEADALTFASPQGDAALRVLAVPPNAGRTHDDIVRNALKPSEGKLTRGAINGFSASHFVGARQVDKGQVQALEATLVTGPNENTFVMLYLFADPAARQRSLTGLMATEQSFRAMTAADRQAARPWTVRTVAFPRGGFAELARAAAVSDKRLRLLNGSYGRDEPPLGQKVKVVVAE
jgi:predicted Zn-dependent protease